MEINQAPGKKIKKILVYLALCLVFIGAYAVFDFIFPKAPKNFEFTGTLSNPQISYGQEDSSYLNEDAFYKIQIHLYQAKPTRNQTHNDHPQTNSYYKIEFESDEGYDGRLYLYEFAGDVYFEIPYCGIYKTEPNVLTLIQ